MINPIGAGDHAGSTRPAVPTRSQAPHAAAVQRADPSAAARTRSPDTGPSTASPQPFRQTVLSFRVDVRSGAVQIDVVDAATKATLRTIALDRPAGSLPNAAPPPPLLVDRHA